MRQHLTQVHNKTDSLKVSTNIHQMNRQQLKSMQHNAKTVS